MSYVTGVARRSLGRPDPVLHLVVVNGGPAQEFLWCTGGPGAAGVNTMRQRRCPSCLALARQYLVECDVEDDEDTPLDWYLGREVPRKALYPLAPCGCMVEDERTGDVHTHSSDCREYLP